MLEKKTAPQTTNESASITIEQRVALAKLSIAAKTARDTCIDKFNSFTASSIPSHIRVEDAHKAQLELSNAPGTDKAEAELANAWYHMLTNYSWSDWRGNTENMDKVKTLVKASDTRHESYIKAAPALLMLPPDKREEIAKKSITAKKARDAFYTRIGDFYSNKEFKNKTHREQLMTVAADAYDAQHALKGAIPAGQDRGEDTLLNYFNHVIFNVGNAKFDDLSNFLENFMQSARVAADARHHVYTGNFANATELLNASAAAAALSNVAPKAETVAPKKWSVYGVLAPVAITGCALVAALAFECLTKVSSTAIHSTPAVSAAIFVVGASTLAYKYFCCSRNNEVEGSRFY